MGALEYILQILRSGRFDYTTEAELQAAIEGWLEGHGLVFEREHILGPEDRPDFFFIETGIALECKVKGSRMAIYRQLERYAQHCVVRGIILVTGRAMTCPPEINGKPVRVHSIGEAWL